jgi:hypothetical protein
MADGYQNPDGRRRELAILKLGYLLFANNSGFFIRTRMTVYIINDCTSGILQSPYPQPATRLVNFTEEIKHPQDHSNVIDGAAPSCLARGLPSSSQVNDSARASPFAPSSSSSSRSSTFERRPHPRRDAPGSHSPPPHLAARRSPSP